MKGLWATIIMLTRLPIWRLYMPDKKYFEQTLTYWPLVGYISGSLMLGVIFVGQYIFPINICIIIAIIARLLLTGAIHEDGLADFFDGFGGGRDKENILRIMKDSHIGSYGTIGLIIYFLLYYISLVNISVEHFFMVIIAGNVFSKLIASILANSLQYARTEKDSKNSVVYDKSPVFIFILVGLISCIPIIFLSVKTIIISILFVIIISIILREYFRRKIGGYTGDCCGASALILELCFYLGVVASYSLNL